MSYISDKITEIQSTLRQGVTLLAVSKFHPAEKIQQAYDAGHRSFGESRPQELKAKYDALPKDIKWHMIGHLQTNKIKYIAPFVHLIESLDSERLAAAIDREAAKCGRTIDCLLEIHVTDEESKSGWEWSELKAFVEAGGFQHYPNIRIRGVMGMATFTDDESVIREDFRRLRVVLDNVRHEFPKIAEDFSEFSIGMSDDYRTAIEYGSTMIRIGSMIFGERSY